MPTRAPPPCATPAASPRSLLRFGQSGLWRVVSNLLVAIAGHALYYFLFRSSAPRFTDDSTLQITIVSSAWWLAVCHGSSFAAEFLDRRYYRAKSPSSPPSFMWAAKLQNTHPKLQRTPPSIGFWTMWTTCILNELLACIVFGLFFVHADIAVPAKRSLAYFDSSDSALVAFCGTVVYVLAIAAAYDLVFFVGHYAMHRVPGLYRATHKLHHLSHADAGISHHVRA
jgi:hypothetical protein